MFLFLITFNSHKILNYKEFNTNKSFFDFKDKINIFINEYVERIELAEILKIKNKDDINLNMFPLFSEDFENMLFFVNFSHDFSTYYFLFVYENKNIIKKDLIRLFKKWEGMNKHLIKFLSEKFNLKKDDIVEFLI